MVNFKTFFAKAFLALPVLSAALSHPMEFTACDLEDIFTREFLDELSLSERGYFSNKGKNKKDKKDETRPVTVAKNPRELEEEALDMCDDMLDERDWKDLEELY